MQRGISYTHTFANCVNITAQTTALCRDILSQMCTCIPTGRAQPACLFGLQELPTYLLMSHLWMFYTTLLTILQYLLGLVWHLGLMLLSAY